MAKEKQLSAYLISYNYHEAHSATKEVMLRNIIIVAYDKKEAGDMFIEWLLQKNIYERVDGVVVQKMRKSKKNKQFFTQDYYDKEVLYLYHHNDYMKRYHGDN